MRAVHTIGFLLLLVICSAQPARAQQSGAVEWLTFEQLEDSLAVKPKKVFIDFYTDWCTYCRKMDRKVFTKPEVIDLLNSEYYAVKMDAESSDTIHFDGQPFVNDQLTKSRNPVHQMAQLLALRDGTFVPPVMVLIDEKFRVTQRYFEYMDSKRLLKALQQP